MKCRIITFLVVLLFAPAAWGAAAQLTDSYLDLGGTQHSKSIMAIRCDNSAAIAGTTGIGGETCESGDWSRALDCQDAQHLTVQFFEYGTGSAQLFVWNCQKIAGSTSAGGTSPGEEAPASAPSAADPDPLCYELTTPAGIADFDGLAAGDTFLHLSGNQFHHVIAEIENCTSDCDSTVILSCGE